MKTKLKNLVQQLLQSPRRFPVEAALGIVFFIMAVWHAAAGKTDGAEPLLRSVASGDILWLFVPLTALSFWLHRVNRWAYAASFFLFLPLMFINLKPFTDSYGLVFLYVLAAILVVVGNRRMDNRPFTAHALHVVKQMFLGLLISGILTLAVVAIMLSFVYIFGIVSDVFIEHIIRFIWFVLAPQICCTLVRLDEDDVREPGRVLRFILDYILSPAIIIYTVILYAYFIKITFAWDLPKGGVAWMVMGFIAAAMIGHMAQSVLDRRHYDWFYRHFTLIALPPLIMYWVGTLYRIRLYGLTEDRCYLLVAGGLMTLFVLMLFRERTGRYQVMALLIGAAIILFTYVPGISAKNIGLRSQEQRLAQFIDELKLNDPATGKLNDSIDLGSIQQDSLTCTRYREASSVISYVRKVIGSDQFKEQYGEWSHSEWEFHYFDRSEAEAHRDWVERKSPIDLGEYRILLPGDNYHYDYDEGVVTVSIPDVGTVLTYPVKARFEDSTQLRDREQLLTFHNDSLMIVLESIYLDHDTIAAVFPQNSRLYRKPSTQNGH